MGLDDFSTDSSNSSSSSSTDSSDSTDESGPPTKTQDTLDGTIDEHEMTFYNAKGVDLGITPMERKGAMSSHSMAELAETTDGDLVYEEDHIKLHLPTFIEVTGEKLYDEGERYQVKHNKGEPPRAAWHGTVVACMAVNEIKLGEMNKEVAMFDTGSPSKKRVMNSYENKLGEDHGSDTTVYMNFFGDVFFMRDMAQANEQYRVGELVDRDKVGDKVIKRQQLRISLD